MVVFDGSGGPNVVIGTTAVEAIGCWIEVEDVSLKVSLIVNIGSNTSSGS